MTTKIRTKTRFNNDCSCNCSITHVYLEINHFAETLEIQQNVSNFLILMFLQFLIDNLCKHSFNLNNSK